MQIDIKQTLDSLGYELLDRGDYWQTSAVFRGGDNKTAIQIYKDSGVWKDFVNQTPYMNFEKLVQLTLGTDDKNISTDYIKYNHDNSNNLNQSSSYYKIKMEKIYKESDLSRNLPHYDFYLKKGVKKSILEEFKCGLCTEGKMYQRIVFPIYNLNKKIHGFSGRYVGPLKQDRPKWKHLGTKTKWIFPNHLSLDSILEKKQVILVESIGDVLNLYNYGYKNCLCTFGTSISPSLVSYLSGLGLDKIILSFNNDTNSNSRNPGLEGAIKSFFKLIKFFNFDKIIISLPTKNDFGDMSDTDFSDWHIKTCNINQKEQINYIIKNYEEFLCSQSKSLKQSFLKFKKEFNE